DPYIDELAPSDRVLAILKLHPHLDRPFFFSSRRRHTSWPRDWSSDVCSSDLPNSTCPRPSRRCRIWSSRALVLPVPRLAGRPPRSEERRVGKEWRSRWSP